MGPGHYWWGGGWGMFPLMMPFFMILIVVAVLYLLFGRLGRGVRNTQGLVNSSSRMATPC